MATTIDYLETYLQDHRAGAELGSDLARRVAEQNVGTPYERFLATLADEIDEDVETLEGIMERFGVSKSILKTTAAKVAEKIGRLKPNNELLSYSPLSRVLELEGLRSGVQGKLALWDSLAQRESRDDRLDPQQIASLVERAERQLDGLRAQHRTAAAEAFASDS